MKANNAFALRDFSPEGIGKFNDESTLINGRKFNRLTLAVTKIHVLMTAKI